MRRQLQVGSPELQSRLLLYCDGSVNMDSWGVCCTYGVCGSKESAYVKGLYWTHETDSGASKCTNPEITGQRRIGGIFEKKLRFMQKAALHSHIFFLFS